MGSVEVIRGENLAGVKIVFGYLDGSFLKVEEQVVGLVLT